jgi:hypothetical protein
MDTRLALLAHTEILLLYTGGFTLRAVGNPRNGSTEDVVFSVLFILVCDAIDLIDRLHCTRRCCLGSFRSAAFVAIGASACALLSVPCVLPDELVFVACSPVLAALDLM